MSAAVKPPCNPFTISPTLARGRGRGARGLGLPCSADRLSQLPKQSANPHPLPSQVQVVRLVWESRGQLALTTLRPWHPSFQVIGTSVSPLPLAPDMQLTLLAAAEISSPSSLFPK